MRGNGEGAKGTCWAPAPGVGGLPHEVSLASWGGAGGGGVRAALHHRLDFPALARRVFWARFLGGYFGDLGLILG